VSINEIKKQKTSYLPLVLIWQHETACRTHHKVQASAGKADMAAVLSRSPDASEDVVPVAAWSCWVDFQDRSVCQDLLWLGAAGRGKPAVPQIKSPSVHVICLCL